IARQGSAGRRKPALRILVGQVLHDGRAFGEQLAAVEHKGGHGALRIDLVKVTAVFERVRLEINLHEIDRHTGLFGHDMRRKRTGPRCVIELHGSPYAAWIADKVHRCGENSIPEVLPLFRNPEPAPSDGPATAPSKRQCCRSSPAASNGNAPGSGTGRTCSSVVATRNTALNLSTPSAHVADR